MHPTTGKSALETVLCVLHAGGKFGGDDSGYKVRSIYPVMSCYVLSCSAPLCPILLCPVQSCSVLAVINLTLLSLFDTQVWMTSHRLLHAVRPLLLIVKPVALHIDFIMFTTNLIVSLFLQLN